MNQSVLVDRLSQSGYLKTPEILEAFRVVPRADFLPDDLKSDADLDLPLPIGYGQTNSQPLTVAFMMELLHPKPGERVLDVGAGSGWTAALFAVLVGKKGKVVAVERIPQLQRFAAGNLAKYRFSQLKLVRGDATAFDPTQPEFDIIHVAAASETVPDPLRERLAVGGRMLIPIGRDVQALNLITRVSSSEYHERRYAGFSFVPLVSGTLP